MAGSKREKGLWILSMKALFWSLWLRKLLGLLKDIQDASILWDFIQFRPLYIGILL